MCFKKSDELIIKQILIGDKGKVITKKKFSIIELNCSIMPTTEIIIIINDLCKKPIYQNVEESCLPGEIWKIYKTPEKLLKAMDKNKPVEVSNKGRVKIDGKIRKQTDAKGENAGYLVVYGCYVNKYVYQVVAETWLGKDEAYKECGRWEVHHISNNGYDNSTENLIYLPCCIHRKIKHKKTKK